MKLKGKKIFKNEDTTENNPRKRGMAVVVDCFRRLAASVERRSMYQNCGSCCVASFLCSPSAYNPKEDEITLEVEQSDQTFISKSVLLLSIIRSLFEYLSRGRGN